MFELDSLMLGSTQHKYRYSGRGVPGEPAGPGGTGTPMTVLVYWTGGAEDHKTFIEPEGLGGQVGMEVWEVGWKE